MVSIDNPRIAVIGLGYVGLPLAVELANYYDVVGFDISNQRIAALRQGYDATREVTSEKLQKTTLALTNDESAIKQYDIYIVTVPTPITVDYQPDLQPLQSATRLVGRVMAKGAIVVYESTVYPGVTEGICKDILEKESKLQCGQDFYLGYSPERINPGDKKHTLTSITKIVSGQTAEVSAILAKMYGRINQNNIFCAKSIKTAEAAKVIENAQRDINIAFINEITIIFSQLGISIYDVLAAANTKWNFLPFKPGLVGGHCIGVDPYYLAHVAKKVNCEPDVILSGRRTNEQMSTFIANNVCDKLTSLNKSSAQILILGLTFKENIPDLRNTKTLDLINCLKINSHDVDVYDPHADPAEAQQYLEIPLLQKLDSSKNYDCIIATVEHDEFKQYHSDFLQSLLTNDGLIVDIKNMWSEEHFSTGIYYWRL
ncbi:MAG: nucleotide sugar dehydrogenase [Gammaproteobacteria bacterium]